MKSKTKIEKQLRKKENPQLVKTIIECKKKKGWVEVAGLLSAPRKNHAQINLDFINNQSKSGETILIPGKVLSQGKLDKKIKVVALNFSETAKEKLKNSGSQVLTIIEEIKSNPEAKGLKVLTRK